MRIAITGGTGAIGKVFVPMARANGHQLVFLGRTRPADLAEADRWVRFDLSDLADMARPELTSADCLLHLAARIDTNPPDHEAAMALFATNVLGTGRLIDWAAEADIGRLVMASTANFYDPRVICANENTPIRPLTRTLYLSSKAAQEALAREKCLDAGIAFAAMRIASVIGTGTDLVSTLTRSALDGRSIVLDNPAYGADFVDVNDVAKGLLLAIEMDLEGDFNLSSGKRHTLSDIVSVIAEEFEGEVAIEGCDSATLDSGFPAVDCDRMRAHGYAPRDLRAVIKDILKPAPSIAR